MIKNSIYINGFVETKETITVINPASGEVVGKVGSAGHEDVHKAIENASMSKSALRKLSSMDRSRILTFIAEKLKVNYDQIAETITLESGKPIRYSRGEVQRAIQTFTIAAEECKRLPSEYIQLDWTEPGRGKEGLVKSFPVGVVAGISPFNFPLNLVAHKVAPAIAAGCPIVLKPASKTPLTALKLAEIIHESELPPGAFSVLPCSRSVGNILVKDDRIALLSFTGSPEVGWEMKKNAGKKKVVLELGGNAGVLIDETADVNHAIKRCLIGGFAYSGQVCIHAQRIMVHETVYDRFVEGFLNGVENLVKGDPLLETTDVAEMIDESNAQRVEAWIKEAVDQRASILIGGKRSNGYVEPTVMTDTSDTMKVYCEEVFGPVVIVEKVATFEEGLQQINNSKFGLQAGIFVNDQNKMRSAFNDLEVGGVIINDVPTFRVDHMPYGGVKDSGLGREGVKYAIQDMMEPRILVW